MSRGNELDSVDLSHEFARDIAWAMGSPNLIASIPGLPLNGPLRGLEFREQHRLDCREDWSKWVHLESLRRAGKSGWRVGAYFEQVVETSMHLASGWDVLGSNVPVRRERQTLGAFDLILRNPEGEVEHWELAVKFYLGVPGAESMRDWLGPNQRDTLHKKVERMRSHQLPLSRREEGKLALRTLGVEADPRRQGHLKGGLFLPAGKEESCSVPAGGNIMGRWVESLEIEACLDQRKDSMWVKREKPNWLGPSRATERMGRGEVLLATRGMKRPEMWSELRRGTSGCLEEVARWFFVPPSWTERALATRK